MKKGLRYAFDELIYQKAKSFFDKMAIGAHGRARNHFLVNNQFYQKF